MADNYTQYGEYFVQLCHELIVDPLCLNHYEYDIQWSLLHLLLELSRNPVTALATNKAKVILPNNREIINESQDALDIHMASTLVRQDVPLNELSTSILWKNNTLSLSESDLSVIKKCN